MTQQPPYPPQGPQQPTPGQPPRGYVPPPKPKKPWYKRPLIWVGIVLVLMIAGCIRSVAGLSSSDPTTEASSSVTTAPPATSAAPSATATPPTTPATTKAASKPATTKAEPPKLTTSQEQAVLKAESYLDFEAFSKSGLVEQLEYEGFSKKDAEFAVNHITVDWMEQAAKKAKSYMDMESFSRSGLIQQLEYEGFTKAQASHGADSVGL